MRVLFALPGLHRVSRGAEVAFESLAERLGSMPGVAVTLAGMGPISAGRPYRCVQVTCRPREAFERWPRLPLLRSETAYEEMAFAIGLRRAYDCTSFDLTVTAGYPYVNWLLRWVRSRGRRPAHVFVTQNGDWPARRRGSEYWLFGCDGLVTLNPEDYDRHRDRWFSTLIPNGVDLDRFAPGPGARSSFGLPHAAPIVVVVSALDTNKRVVEAIRCAARIPALVLVVLGDGPLREIVDAAGAALMPGRFRRLTLPRDRMPDMYRCADVVLHTCLAESFGNVYVEGLATGLPVVAHESALTRWILGEEGTLVDCRNEAAVVEGLHRALLPQSPDRRARRRRRAELQFAWSSVAGQYLRFFEQVLVRSNRALPPAPAA